MATTDVPKFSVGTRARAQKATHAAAVGAVAAIDAGVGAHHVAALPLVRIRAPIDVWEEYSSDSKFWIAHLSQFFLSLMALRRDYVPEDQRYHDAVSSVGTVPWGSLAMLTSLPRLPENATHYLDTAERLIRYDGYTDVRFVAGNASMTWDEYVLLQMSHVLRSWNVVAPAGRADVIEALSRIRFASLDEIATAVVRSCELGGRILLGQHAMPTVDDVREHLGSLSESELAHVRVADRICAVIVLREMEKRMRGPRSDPG